MTSERRSPPLTATPVVGGRYAVGWRVRAHETCPIFAAWDRKEGQWVAVEVLTRGSMEDRAAFIEAADAINGMTDPNAPQTTDVDGGGLRPYQAGLLSDGGSAAGWLRRHGPMPPRLACEIVGQVASGLSALHERRVLHGAVCPDALLFRRDLTCVVSGLGSARAGQEDPQPDLYDLGLTLLELVTAKRVRRSPGLDLAAETEGLPAALATVIQRACSSDPEARFASADELGAAVLFAMAELPAIPRDAPPLVHADLPQLPPNAPGSVPPERRAELAQVLVSAVDPIWSAKETPMLPPPPHLGGEVPKPAKAEVLKPALKPLGRKQVATLAAAALAAAALALTATVSASVMTKARTIGAAQRDASSAVPAMLEALETNRGLLEELERAGGDRRGLDLRWSELEQAPELQRGAAALRLVRDLDDAVGQVTRNPRASGDKLGLAQQMKVIRDAAEPYAAASELWVTSTQHPQGRLAVGLGLAEAPPW